MIHWVALAVVSLALAAVSLLWAQSRSRAHAMMAERVDKLVRVQGELIANVAHELRTPLSRVRVVLDLIADGGDATSTRERLTEIARDFEELERLVDDVLMAARLDLNEPERFPLRTLETTSVDELLRASATRFTAMHGTTHRLTVEVPAEPVKLLVDWDLLRRAIGNLLDNARKYSKPGSAITLRGSLGPSGAIIEVVDEGVGINAAELTQLFTPFFRGDRSRSRQTGGVGLGLTITKRIVEAHGGRVSVTSTPGAGTRVRLDIPELSERALPIPH